MGLEFVNVESFSLNAKTTDLSSNSLSSFTPGSSVRINALAKSSSQLINLSSINAAVIYPNGSAVSFEMNASSLGNYYYDFTTPSNLEGSYSLRINATYNGASQVESLSFSAESSAFYMFSINTNYLDEVEQGGRFRHI